MMMRDHWMPWGMPWVGGIMMLVFWALVIVGAVFLVRWIIAQGRAGGGGQETPVDILKRRYAKGEISREEFERMKRDLE